MSLLPWWDHEDWDEDDHPVPPPELLTISQGRVWWSDTTVVPDLD